MNDGFAHVKQLAADYRALTDAYDAELAAAHNGGHGTPEVIEHLQKACAMGPQLMDSLKRYQDAVTALEAIGKEQSSHSLSGRGPH